MGCPAPLQPAGSIAHGAGADSNILVWAAGWPTHISVRGGAGRSEDVCWAGVGFTLVAKKPTLTYI